jgi:SAM-dependent methyltransferase
LQEDLALSRRWPWRALAMLNAAFLLGLLLLAGATLRATGARRPDGLDRELGEAYPHVPEMAVHKKIELAAFSRQAYRGMGVDFGCGNGIVGGMLMRHAPIEQLHGIDIMPQVDLVRKAGYAGCTAASVEKVPLPDNSFDFAISVCVIEHVEGLDLALGEAARLLVPGGWFYFTTPSPRFRMATAGYRILRAFGMARAAARFAAFKDAHAMQYHYLDDSQWRTKLTAKGFGAVRIEPLFSRRQLMVYDLLNYSTYFLRLYPCETMIRWFGRWPRLRGRAAAATAAIAAAVADWPVDATTATHWFIAARRQTEKAL